MRILRFLMLAVSAFLFMVACDSSGTSTDVPSEAIYTVTFDSNGGSPANPVPARVTAGGTVAGFPVVELENADLSGWNTERDGTGMVFDGSTRVTGDITVYAQWAVRGYRVTFDPSPGTGGGVVVVPYGGTVAELPPASQVGYTFLGWFYNGEPFDTSTAVEQDITVTARWEPINLYSHV